MTLEPARDDAAAARLVVAVITVVVAASFVLGVVAAAVGGPLEALGNGFGGLQGVPALLLLVAALAGPVVAWRSAQPRPWPAIGLWPLVVLMTFAFVAHGIDPCVIGLLDGASRLGEQPLCERFGSDLNIHTRYHLLLHAAVAAVAVGAVRRWFPVWRVWSRTRAPNP